MTILSLDHYTIRTKDPDHLRQFYEQVVGLRAGDRPPFSFPGYWLYGDDGTAILHLYGMDADWSGGAAGQGGGAIDHVAFRCRNLVGMRQKLDALRLPYRERSVPLLGLIQLFLTDPEGIVLELNFPEGE